MELSYNIKNNDCEIDINITNDHLKDLEDCDGAIVIPFFKTCFVMTYHPKLKAWKFPEGIKYKEENIEECVRRQAYEEAGAILSYIVPVGYYILSKDGFCKKTAIFVADIDKFEPKPRSSETDVVKLFDEIPNDICKHEELYDVILCNIDKNLLLIENRG